MVTEANEVTAEAAEEQPSAADLAADMYIKLLPAMKDSLEKLSTHRMKRVLMALMEHPFENPDPKFNNLEEARAFELGTRINDQKAILMRAVMEMKKEEIEKLLAEQTAEQTKENA